MPSRHRYDVRVCERAMPAREVSTARRDDAYEARRFISVPAGVIS